MEGTKALEVLADILGPLIRQKEAREFGIGAKHDVTGSPGTNYLHGPGGILSFPGVDPVVFHTIMGAESILGQLPSTPSLNTDPTFETLTGVTGDTGSEKSAVCDNAPVAGLLKSCIVNSVFGRYERATNQVELNRLGQRTDRSDPMDLTLVGTPMASTFYGAGFDPDPPANLLVNEIAAKFWERNISFHRLLSQQVWSGTPANNAAAGGYKEMTGIQLLVSTGYKDVTNGQLCPALDAYVRSFANLRVDTNGNALVAAVTDMYYQARDRAIRTGVMPVRWVFAMRPQLFYAVSAVWPCAYLSTNCQNLPTGTVNNIDSQDAVRFRDEMRRGRYLLIDGERVDVILDEGIPELNGNEAGQATVPRGCFATDIYLLPMSVAGGRAVTYLEYFQYSNPSLNSALDGLALARVEGAFLTWPRQTNQCVQWQSKIEPRLIMRTPWLSARLQNVNYCPIQHTRDSFPAEPYFADGGLTNRLGPSYYRLWAA